MQLLLVVQMVGRPTVDTAMSNTINNRTLIRETCELCDKNISIGQSTIVCKKCDHIFHGSCVTNNNFRMVRGFSYCMGCILKEEIFRYNPFLDLFENGDSDKFFDEESPDLVEAVDMMSNILENCNSYDSNEFQNLLETSSIFQTRADNNLFSSYFLNIDGNRQNFDQLVADIMRLKHNFSVIGLAETNIESESKDLYEITSNYTSVYQSRLRNKKKGSGIGLYIHNKFNFTVISEFTNCTQDIECLFVRITNTEQPVTVGVVYRPPSGNIQLFNQALEDLLSELPDKNCYILGDFNINLHNMSPLSHQVYEETIISHGYTPLISIATHEQPHCMKTCIDNILCNSPESIITSGTFTNKISHHSPVFQVSKVVAPTEKADKITI